MRCDMDGTGYLLEVHRREMQEVEQQSAKLAHKRREEEASLNEQFEEFRRAVALPQPAQDNSKNVFHRAYAALAAAMFAASMILLQ
jgi:hypothetical protein